jgi:hypothetical protein
MDSLNRNSELSITTSAIMYFLAWLILNVLIRDSTTIESCTKEANMAMFVKTAYLGNG